jgi:hypothetical protein
MTDKAHWPFGPTADPGEARQQDRQKEREAEREQARLQAEVERHALLRHDRFLVGGRAHVRKHGLS